MNNELEINPSHRRREPGNFPNSAFKLGGGGEKYTPKNLYP